MDIYAIYGLLVPSFMNYYLEIYQDKEIMIFKEFKTFKHMEFNFLKIFKLQNNQENF